MTNRKIKKLFLQQSYQDSWEDYERSLYKENYITWDYVILTASNEEQASTYREQIKYRKKHNLLAKETEYVVLADPEGKRVGSGGATFNVMRYIAEQNPEAENPFSEKRILVIHSGGDSKRVPQYSAIGKLFSPVPRELPNGYASTLFDEFIIGMSGVPSRIKEGMLVLSGDVLLLFNPLQIDLQYHGAAAISIKEHVSIGKNHGVFLNDGVGYVGKFLHKQSEEKLRSLGAVNEQENVDLDTGAVVFDSKLLKALYSLISTDGKSDEDKFRKFVNEEARISFYGDFLYPLAKESTLEQYYKEAAEGTINDALISCREELWKVLAPFSMKLLCLSPAEFVHFGTTKELLQLIADEIDDYEFLGWKRSVLSTVEANEYSTNNAYIGQRAEIGANSYIENSYILDNTKVGEHSIVSNLKLRSVIVPDNVVMHGLPLSEDKFVVRIYDIHDNPKGAYQEGTSFLGLTLDEFMKRNQLSVSDLWDNEQAYLWLANLYPVCDCMEEAVKYSMILYRMVHGMADKEEVALWKKAKRVSLYSSFNLADAHRANEWQRELEHRVVARKFIKALEKNEYYEDALNVFGKRGITEDIYDTLLSDAEEAPFSLKIRIYYAISRYMKTNNIRFKGDSYDVTETLCFKTIQQAIYENAVEKIKGKQKEHKIREQKVLVELPVRVNWGGGWTDTPPHCNEKGGLVLNAAIKLNGIYPIQVEIRRLEEYHIEFESTDIGVFGTVHTLEEIQSCNNPYDSFALHKAALISSGLIPLEDTRETLQDILKRLGGGIYLSTQVIGIPKGSGLGTSSILAAACIKAIYKFLGEQLSDEEIYEVVLGMEQIMSTGGGWQDQVGGLTEGIKFVTTKPGVEQKIKVEKLVLSDQVIEELQERFALIYTGQRRLARNLLRNVVGSYIGNRPESISALRAMKPLTVLMKYELECGNIDAFAELLNQQWQLSKQLDESATNTCINQIFVACEDLIDGQFICGAGGGGFLQVILKKGVTRDMLRHRLTDIFQNSGVDVWESEFV